MAEEIKTPETEEETAPVETAAEEVEEAAESAESALQKQYDELNERYLRMAAEYDNFRKRSQREREAVHGDAVAYAVTELLTTADNLSRALAQPTADAEYKKGVELTFTGLMTSFEKLGVTPIEDAPGTPFDPNLHNAVMHIDDEELGENVIAEVFQKGYRMGEKIIRYSMVKVAN